MLLFVGERREGDMEWHAGARSVPTRCVDKRQPAPCDVEAPGIAAEIIRECEDGLYSYLHGSFVGAECGHSRPTHS